MEMKCIDIERVAEIAELPAGDPVREHVESCPRCRNLLRSYLSFVAAEPVEGFAVDGARRQLDALIDARVGAGATPGPSRFSVFLHRMMRPAPLLTAAAVVVIAAVVIWQQQSRTPEGVNLREEPAANHMTLAPAEVRPDGSIHLRWGVVPGADAYHVRVYGPGLTEVYRSGEVTESSLTIDRSDLPADLPPTLDLMWRVYALHAGDVLQTSAPGSIRTR